MTRKKIKKQIKKAFDKYQECEVTVIRLESEIENLSQILVLKKKSLKRIKKEKEDWNDLVKAFENLLLN